MPFSLGPNAIESAGEMGRRVLVHPWHETPIGPMATWSASLRTAVRMVLTCKLPMYLAWGDARTQIYNDAYIPILGPRHPAALGGPAPDTWPEIWSTIGPMWEDMLKGHPVGYDDFKLTIERFGYPEDRYFNFSYSPVPDDDGEHRGVLVTFVDTTDRVLAEQRARFQLELSDGLRGLDAPVDITRWTCQLLGRFLDARRAGYALVDDGVVDVSLVGWHDDSVETVVGQRFPLDALGSGIAQELHAGRTVRIDNVATDARVDGRTALFDALHTPAALMVPLLRDAQLIALVFVGAREPRHWMSADATLVEDAAERTRAAVERSIAEEARRRAEAEHRFVLDRTLAAVVVHDASGAVTFSNPMASQLLGMSVEQMQGREPTDPDWMFVRENGEPMPVEEYPVCIVTRTRVPLHDYVVGIIHSTGAAPVWALVNAYPELDADGNARRVVASFVDITRRKQMENELRVSEQRSAMALDVAQLGTWSWDVASGEIIADARARQICGLPDEHTTLAASAERVHPDDWPRVEQALRAASDPAGSGEYAEEFRWRRPDGSIAWALARGLMRFEGSGASRRPVSLMGSVIDTTERRRMLETLRQADRRKDEFLAMLAHALRNPLAPISTAAQLLHLAADDPKRIQEAATVIGRQVAHMTEMVDDLLDVSRVTRGLVELHREPVDMRAVLSQAIEQVQPLIQSRGHKLVVSDYGLSAVVDGDRHRLTQIVANLLNNAAKYTAPNGEIGLELTQNDRHVTVRVRDTGIGISDELLPYVFDLFTQAERTPDRSQGGLGIGLALVRSIAELHGGRVLAYSDGPGQGSTFTLVLPCSVAEVVPQATSPHMPTGTSRKRILVVDDNRDAADTLATLLSVLGHGVRVATSGAEALAIVDAEREWDAFIVDIGMPDMTGYELARHIRGREAFAAAHFIALTGYGQPGDRASSKAAGFQDHLVKPADVNLLCTILDTPSRATAVG